MECRVGFLLFGFRVLGFAWERVAPTGKQLLSQARLETNLLEVADPGHLNLRTWRAGLRASSLGLSA